MKNWAVAMTLAASGLLLPASYAVTLPDGVFLGMTAQDVQQAVPGARPVLRPTHMAGGLIGSLSGPATRIAGVPLVPTYFFLGAQLRRVEYNMVPAASPDGFQALLAWGRVEWGSELLSDAPEGSYATWFDRYTDAYLQRTNSLSHPAVRLVIKVRVLKDASEL